jgi:O-antigen ligase
MTLSPTLRDRIWMAAASLTAIALGVEIAQGTLVWPSLVAGALAVIALTRIQPLRIPSLLIGGVVFGYIVGNRGFAQISITGRVPLLPAEFVLLIAGTILVFRSALTRSLPVTKEPLNLALVVWVCLSSVRFPSDMHIFGVMALRDFATVYYALFFFIVQDAGAKEADRTFMFRCMLWGLGILAVVIPVYQLYPDFFLSRLTFRGVPLIFFKGDLEGTFAAAGSVLFFACFESRGSRRSLVLCLALAALAVESNNRASMLGLAAAAAVLGISGRWRFAAALGSAAAVSTVLVLAVAIARNESWRTTPVYDAYERVASLVDPSGARTYTGEETFNKGDNNVFRSLWWRVTIDETVSTNPWAGLGWGYDLAETFERIYYPEGNDEFSARSPHNILVTLFARTGVVGFVPFLIVVGAIGIRSVRAIRARRQSAYLWAAACVILTSSCFGVVLEGPMGAVVFWSMLGLASSYDLYGTEDPHPPLSA